MVNLECLSISTVLLDQEIITSHMRFCPLHIHFQNAFTFHAHPHLNNSFESLSLLFWNPDSHDLWIIWGIVKKVRHLTLFGPGGGHIVSPLSRICTYLQERIEKNLTFLNYERAVHFLPCEVISFRWKNKVRRKYQNFIRGDPYEPGQTPLWRNKVSKVKHFFGGFLASKLHESF